MPFSVIMWIAHAFQQVMLNKQIMKPCFPHTKLKLQTVFFTMYFLLKNKYADCKTPWRKDCLCTVWIVQASSQQEAHKNRVDSSIN